MGGGVENTQTRCVGFTLAELLAVIAILGVIALIAFPAVNKIIKSSKEKAYESQKEIILSSAKNWGLDHLGQLSEIDDTYLTIEELKRDGYIEAKQVINPNTDEEMTGCIIIHYDDSYNQYVYEYNEAGCGEASNLPIITLNGNRTMSVELNGTYTELGATAKAVDGTDISSSIVITGSVDTTKAGTYYIKYNVTYNGVKAREVTRTVKVVGQGGSTVDPGGKDPEPSNGLRLALSPSGLSEYHQATTVSVTATPATGTTIRKLTYKLDDGEELDVENNQIILDTDGEHVLEVTAIDYYGNAKTVTGHYLIDVTAPTLIAPNKVINISEVKNYDLLLGVSAEDGYSGVSGEIITSGDLVAVQGNYTVTYTISDRIGNIAKKDAIISVVPDWLETTYLMNLDPDGNPRFVGANPNNYVKFNNELWRVIGTFDGQMKIIRNEPYDTRIAWSTSKTNNWGYATLQSQLNSTVLSDIESTSKSYIDTTHIWNVGACTYSDATRAEYYQCERGTRTYGNSQSTWTGAIGLIYPSDYGYATSDTIPECSATLYYWYSGEGIGCRDNSWLHDSSNWQWTITPYGADTGRAYIVHDMGMVSWGQGGGTYVTNEKAAYPALYLKPEIKIKSGTGSSTDPFILTQ